MLRIGPSFPGETGSFMKVDQKRRQVTLYDPSTVGHVSQTHRKMGVAAPKMFAFDSIFESDCSQVRFVVILWMIQILRSGVQNLVGYDVFPRALDNILRPTYRREPATYSWY